MAQQDAPHRLQPSIGITTTKRPVTSCLECYRRKQKCNRVKPCNQCCARKVPEKCYFSTGTGSADSSSSSSAHENLLHPIKINQLENDSNFDDDPPLPSSLVSRAGYSATLGNTTFLRLKRESLWDACFSPSLPSSVSRERPRSLYLHIIALLPPRDTINTLLGVFFQDIHLNFMAIDQYHFRGLFHQWLTVPVEQWMKGSLDNSKRELLYFPGLLFQVLAQALYYISPRHPAAEASGFSDPAHCERLSQKFFLAGSKLVSLLGRQNPTLCSVEHDLVSCFWLKNSSRGTDAWHRLGNAIRQAQELGLHRLPQNIEQTSEDSLDLNLMKMWDLEHKKHIWTRLFFLDSTLALTLGRPRFLHREDFSTPAPLDCEYPKDPTKTLPLPCDSLPFSSILIFLSLAHKIHDILSLLSTGIYPRDYFKVLSIHDEINSLRERFPLSQDYQSDIVSNIARTIHVALLSTINSILMTLHRPFIASQPTSRSAAIKAALDGLDLQQSIFDLTFDPHSRVYGTVFATIDASVFLCGIMKELPPQDPIESQRIRRAIVQGIGRLAAVKEKCPLADSGEQVLRLFYMRIQMQQSNTIEQMSWLQLDAQQSGVWDSNGHLDDILLPPPQQPPYQTFQSLFGGRYNPTTPLDPFEDQDSIFTNPLFDNIGNFSSQEDPGGQVYYDIQ